MPSRPAPSLLQLRFVVGTDRARSCRAASPSRQAWLPQIELEQARDVIMNANTPRPRQSMAKFAAPRSKRRAPKAKHVANFGGSLPTK